MSESCTSLWYYAADKEKKGPISWADLCALAKSGALGPADMVLPAGAQQWLPARSVPGLADTSLMSFRPLAEIPLAESVDASLQPPPPSDGATPRLPETAGWKPTGGIITAKPVEGTFPPVPGYEILAELGRGGMGVVYMARQVHLKRVVALKMILAGDYASDEARARFRAEAESVARIQHPGIVQIYDIGEHDGKPYFSLEYVSGGSLHDQIDGPQPPRPAAELVRVLALAMQAAHAGGIVHRDLKPGNILLQPAGSPSSDTSFATAWGIPKIGDFGLAKQLDREDRTKTGDVLGTPQYMAPEQAMGHIKGIAPWTDIYALGAILYELLTGRPPFQGESAMDTLLLVTTTEPVPPRRLQPKVPRDLETICLKCLEKAPARRYPTGADLADDLQRFLTGQPIVARPVGPLERAAKWARRRPAVAGLAAAVLLVTLIGLAGVLWQWRDALAARADADWARGQAESEASRAKAALADAENNLYFHRVALAHREWQFRHIGRARTLLEESPKGRRDWEWRYLRRLFYPELATLPGTGEELLCVIFSPDGRYLASAGIRSTITIYDSESRKELATCRGHTGTVWRLAFSPNGQMLASGGEDKTVRLWEVPSGKPLRTLGESKRGVHGLAFHPDGTKLAAAGADLKTWEIASGKLLMHVNPPKVGYQRVSFHPEGQHLAAVGFGTPVHVWETKIGKGTSVPHDLERAVYGMAYSPDGKWLATCGADQVVDVREVATGKRAYLLRGANEMLTDVTFAPDSRRVAAACSDESVLVWSLDRAQPLVLRGHTGPVNAVSFAADGRRLASAGGGDGAIRLWDPQTDPEMQSFRGDTAVDSVAFSADSRLVAANSGTAVKVWDRQSQQVVWTLQAPDLDHVEVLALSIDGRFLAAGGNCYGSKQPPGVVVVWELKGGQPVQLFRLPDHAVSGLVFAPDGTLFASSGQALVDDGPRKRLPIRGWNVETGKETITLPGHVGGAMTMAVSPDGRLLASGSPDLTVRLWDLKTAKETAVLTGHTDEITGVAFQNGGKLLASSSRDRAIKLWNVSAGTLERTLHGHSQQVLSVAFSKDGKRLASAGGDASVKFWDTATGQEVLTLSRHVGAVQAVAFSPDGHFLVSGGRDKQVLIWHAP